MRRSLSFIALVALTVTLAAGCGQNQPLDPLAPESFTVETLDARASTPGVGLGPSVVYAPDDIGAEAMAFMVGIIDNILSGDPTLVSQGVADLESLRPGITNEILQGLAGASGRAVLQFVLPELPTGGTLPLSSGGGKHTVTIVVTGKVTVKKGSTISFAGSTTEFVEDTTFTINETFNFEFDCGEGCSISSHTKTTKKFDGKNIKFGTATNGVDITVEGFLSVEVEVKPCCEEQTPSVRQN